MTNEILFDVYLEGLKYDALVEKAIREGNLKQAMKVTRYRSRAIYKILKQVDNQKSNERSIKCENKDSANGSTQFSKR